MIEHADQANWDTPDGSLVEVAIAGFLYDLTDDNHLGPEPHDAIQYPGSYIANVISDCEVSTDGSSWLYASGVDLIVYCLQRDMDGVATYFSTRSPKPINQNQSTGMSDPAQVKRLWRKNLYKETI